MVTAVAIDLHLVDVRALHLDVVCCKAAFEFRCERPQGPFFEVLRELWSHFEVLERWGS